jgi:predicted house-cleaning noncanonical NTP pyrophosphatase (MazG superfamily)
METEKAVINSALFDYGSINDEHKKVAEEICKFLRDSNLKEIADVISQRFQLVQIPEYDMTQSKFFKECNKVGIFVACQGFLQEGTGTDAMKYPMVNISGDIRKMDQLIDSIKNG